MMLAPERFEAARQFMETQARSLAAARFRYHFEGASADAVVEQLAAFQNPDGGFGHGLEPDLRTPDSSVICTTMAFQIRRSLAVSVDHPLFIAGLDFLLRSYNAPTQHWRSIPPSAEQSPHAPWWSPSDESEAEEPFGLNPTAEVLGYLYDGRDRVPDELLATVTTQVLQAILVLDGIEMHDLLCCLRLVQTENLPAAVRQPLMAKLSTLIQSAVETHPEAWSGYSLRPLQVIADPESPFLPELEDAVAANLGYEIRSQAAIGAWEPTWSWADDFPDAWAKARVEWSGVLTVDTLTTLQRFGRIEDSKV